MDGNTVEATDWFDPRTIGIKLWQIRSQQGKTLKVVADLADMSKTRLWELEHGEGTPTFDQINRLARALGVAPSEITKLPVPAPPDGLADAVTEALRLAFDEINTGRSIGTVVPIEALRNRVGQLHGLRRNCKFADVAAELPGLVRDVHTSLNAGADRGELVELTVSLHVHVTRLWLSHVSAPTDLVRRCVFLTKDIAEEHGDNTVVGMASHAIADELGIAGSPVVARHEIGSISLPPVGVDNAGFVASVLGDRGMAAVWDNRFAEADGLFAETMEVSRRFSTGEPDSLGYLVTPPHAAVFQIWAALERDDPDTALVAARSVNPDEYPDDAMGRAYYWMNYGRALAAVKEYRNEAVAALLKAEEIFPEIVRRHALARDTLLVLLKRIRRDAVGQELRGMAHRAGVLV
jgi:transcriptional regulator with XRE-family HTH domain